MSVKAAAICIVLFATAFARADETPSEPLLNVQADWTGEQINAPKCSDFTPLGLYGLKWASGYKPCGDEELRAWLSDMRQYRFEKLIRVGYDGARYKAAALKWTQSSFIQTQTMVQDRFFYDAADQNKTVEL